MNSSFDANLVGGGSMLYGSPNKQTPHSNRFQK